MQRTVTRKNERGFTLIELTVSMVVSALIVSVLVGLFTSTTKAFFRQQEIAELQANLRFASEIMRHDIERAGFMLSPLVSVEGYDNTQSFLPLPIMYDERTSAAKLVASGIPDSPIVTLAGNYSTGTSYPFYVNGNGSSGQLACYPGRNAGAGGARIGAMGCRLDVPAAPERGDPTINPFYCSPDWTTLFRTGEMLHVTGGSNHAIVHLTNNADATGQFSVFPRIDPSGAWEATEPYRVSPIHFVSYQLYEAPGSYDPLSTHFQRPDGTQVSTWRLRRIVESEATRTSCPLCCTPCIPAITDTFSGAALPNACCTDLMENLLPYTNDPATSGFNVRITRDRYLEVGQSRNVVFPPNSYPDIRLADPSQSYFAIDHSGPPVEGIEPEIPLAKPWNPASTDPQYRVQRPWAVRSVLLTLRGHTLHEDPDLNRLPAAVVLPADAHDLVPDAVAVPAYYKNGLARVRALRQEIFTNNIALNLDPSSGG